jgi:ArpU family phage transcriptional regulator
VENTDLGLDIDQKETANRVRIFFKYTFPNYLIKAGFHRTDLSSPQLDLTGVASHSGNGVENKMMKILDMQNRCKAIYQAIDHCSDSPSQPFRTILKALYIDELKDWQVANKVKYSDSRYSDLKRYALCQFADSIETWKIKYDVDIPELNIYKYKKA